MKLSQQGVGLVEVLVSLLILAVGILGFSALQLRAIDASSEAMTKLQAMNLARDLSEKIRANQSAYDVYAAKLNASTQSTTATSCVQKNNKTICPQPIDMANFDAAEVIQHAESLGMKIAIPNCRVVESGQNRRCIYVAWNETKAIDSATDSQACTNGGSYLPQAQCVVMEIY